jgi:prephenate dehydratase
MCALISKPVAFQGAHYAFSEMAARQFFGNEINSLPCRTFEEVFETVVQDIAEFGVLPIENSLTGSIHRNYDLLIDYNVKIVAETVLRVAQNLITNLGVNLSDIKTIYSHPQALEQCRRFISTMDGVEAVATYDTAGSVKMIRDKKILDAAAVASRWAAEDYGMQILKEEIEDYVHNFTRFIVIGRKEKVLAPPDKTSIVFSMKSIPGALFKCLSVFALRDIDLLKIESRPIRGKPFSYIFYLSFAGNMQDQSSINAIRHLEEITDFVKILGSYASGKLNL